MPKQNYFTQGQLTDLSYLVLLTLTKPCHGYLIMSKIELLTNGEFTIGSASLYGTLKKLMESNYINLISTDEKKKIYWITQMGLETLRIESEKRRNLADLGIKSIKAFEEENHEEDIL